VKRFFYRVFCGFCLGLSIFAPGFSGSFLAMVMGIYQDLVRIASNPFKNLKKNILFCIPLGIGAAVSAVLFVIFFRFLFEKYEKATYLLFVGLITGNLPEIYKQIKTCGFKKRYLIGAGGAFAAALAFGIFAADMGQASGAQGITASLPILALSGLAGGAVAPVPGMSVTMILIIFGVYGQLLFAAEAFLHFDFTYLLPFGLFGACAIVGLVLASRGIKAVFERVPGFANSMVIGFMAGALTSILAQSLRLHDASFNWLLGGTYSALPTPTRANYTFDGWYTAASGGTKVSKTDTVNLTGNTTLYAHWTAASQPVKKIFSTKYDATLLNWILFFVCFGFIWMWF